MKNSVLESHKTSGVEFVGNQATFYRLVDIGVRAKGRGLPYLSSTHHALVLTGRPYPRTVSELAQEKNRQRIPEAVPLPSDRRAEIVQYTDHSIYPELKLKKLPAKWSDIVHSPNEYTFQIPICHGDIGGRSSRCLVLEPMRCADARNVIVFGNIATPTLPDLKIGRVTNTLKNIVSLEDAREIIAYTRMFSYGRLRMPKLEERVAKIERMMAKEKRLKFAAKPALRSATQPVPRLHVVALIAAAA